MSGQCFSWALQKGLYEALNGAPDVTDLGAVYDAPPMDAPADYVVLGEEIVRCKGAPGEVLHVHTIAITVQSTADGFARAKGLAAAVIGTLEAGSLAVDGARVVDLLFERARARRSRKGLRRIELRFRIILENN